MSSAAITVSGVSKRFRLYHEHNQSLKATILRRRRVTFEEYWALRDVSLDVQPGETVGLIGENGSGKSTLLKCMAKILRPDKGEIRVVGKVSALLELGAGFHPELSGRENVYLNGSILGLGKKEIDRKFDDIVDFAGLGRFIDTPVKSYSSGMYVRLGFSVAINVDPDVLLVDEVLAVGDEQFQRRCNEKFAELKAQGSTIVLVSHTLPLVRKLCEKVALLHEGRLVEYGPAADVINDYLGDVESREEEVVATEPAAEAESVDVRAQVDGIELLGPTGGSTTPATGAPITFRIWYSTKEPLDDAVFRLWFDRKDGFHVATASTRDQDVVPDRLEGSGHIDLTVDRLALLPMTYLLTCTIDTGRAVERPAAHEFPVPLEVAPGVPSDRGGIVSLGGRWAIDTLPPA